MLGTIQMWWTYHGNEIRQQWDNRSLNIKQKRILITKSKHIPKNYIPIVIIIIQIQHINIENPEIHPIKSVH